MKDLAETFSASTTPRFHFTLASYKHWREVGTPLDYVKILASASPWCSDWDQIFGASLSTPMSSLKLSTRPLSRSTRNRDTRVKGETNAR